MATGTPGRPGEGSTVRIAQRWLDEGPWRDEVKVRSCGFAGSSTPASAVVAIPACNESARIEACLRACARSARMAARTADTLTRLLVLVNGTRDDTARRALDWGERSGQTVTVIEVDVSPRLAHAGGARRLALDLAGADVAPDACLLTTDADARPGRDWISANIAHLDAGASLVCGQAVPEPDEIVRLPARVIALGKIEHRYRRGSFELERLIDPDPWNPLPHHGQASGASLAIRKRDLIAVGGVPPVPCAEDRALARRVRAQGLSVLHADDVKVRVSCRTTGRASGGMADTLAHRLHAADPWCDERLEGVLALHDRLVTRARWRAVWQVPALRSSVLANAGILGPLAARLADMDRFETAWHAYERALLEPARKRLRASELRRELPRLLACLDTVRHRHGPGVEPTFSRTQGGHVLGHPIDAAHPSLKGLLVREASA